MVLRRIALLGMVLLDLFMAFNIARLLNEVFQARKAGRRVDNRTRDRLGTGILLGLGLLFTTVVLVDLAM